MIDDYTHFYNYDRIQFKTKLTPVVFRNQFFA
ncbi:MAG: IS3 family transposase [Paludibacteraceae bacterium]|nr:IS3 family transposase [Paludibacteraceae bacterium]